MAVTCTSNQSHGLFCTWDTTLDIKTNVPMLWFWTKFDSSWHSEINQPCRCGGEGHTVWLSWCSVVLINSYGYIYNGLYISWNELKIYKYISISVSTSICCILFVMQHIHRLFSLNLWHNLKAQYVCDLVATSGKKANCKEMNTYSLITYGVLHIVMLSL